MYLNNALANIVTADKCCQNKLNDAIFINRRLFENLKQASYLKYRFEALLFNILPRNTVQVYKALKLYSNREKGNNS